VKIFEDRSTEQILPNIRDDGGNTLLHWAALENQLKFALFLLARGALQRENFSGKTPAEIVKISCEEDQSFQELKNLLQSWHE